MLVLLSCLGTALAIAISGQDGGTSNVVEAIEKGGIQNQPGLEQGEASRNNIRYDLSAIKRAMPENIQTGGLFSSKSWSIRSALIPVNEPPPPPPPPPSTPPLTFIFLGRMVDRGEVTIFLSKDGRQYAAKVNDVLDDTYRVDMITTTDVVLTYIPMNTQQTLAFNSKTIGSAVLKDVMTTRSVTSVQQITPAH